MKMKKIEEIGMEYIGNTEDLTEDYPIKQYERTSKEGKTYKVKAHTRGEQSTELEEFEEFEEEELELEELYELLGHYKGESMIPDRSNPEKQRHVIMNDLKRKGEILKDISLKIHGKYNERLEIHEKNLESMGKGFFETNPRMLVQEIKYITQLYKEITEDLPINEKNLFAGELIELRKTIRDIDINKKRQLKHQFRNKSITFSNLGLKRRTPKENELEQENEKQIEERTKSKKEPITFSSLGLKKKEIERDFLTTDFVAINEFEIMTSDFEDNEDFTVLHGAITRAGKFIYNKDGKEVEVYKDWDNIQEVFNEQSYLPLKASVQKGAHRISSVQGYATNWKPNHETQQMYGDVILFKNLEDITNDLEPKSGFPMSIGFKDHIEGDTQLIQYLDHLALSLGSKENQDVDRCSIGGEPCRAKKKQNN